MTSRTEQLATALIVACALVMTSLFLWDRFAGASDSDTQAEARAEKVDSGVVRAIDSVALGQWQSAKAVRLTEFIDLECPFCATFAKRLDSAKAILGDTLEVRYANFPLTFHRFARTGAAALECAFAAGRGDAYVHAVYTRQDSLGFWSWQKFASDVGIVDTLEFSRCRASAEIDTRLTQALDLAKRLNLRGTPSVFLGDMHYNGPPTLEQLINDVRTLAREEQHRR
jgi:protein-disulfide isomerase